MKLLFYLGHCSNEYPKRILKKYRNDRKFIKFTILINKLTEASEEIFLSMLKTQEVKHICQVNEFDLYELRYPKVSPGGVFRGAFYTDLEDIVIFFDMDFKTDSSYDFSVAKKRMEKFIKEFF